MTLKIPWSTSCRTQEKTNRKVWKGDDCISMQYLPVYCNIISTGVAGFPTGMQNSMFVVICQCLWLTVSQRGFNINSLHYCALVGWGSLCQFPLFHFSRFCWMIKIILLLIEYHIHIWQVSQQGSCGDTCQMKIWCQDYDRRFCNIRKFPNGEIKEWWFNNSHPWCRLWATHLSTEVIVAISYLRCCGICVP